MKLKRRMLAFLTTLAMIMTMFLSALVPLAASAEGVNPTLQASKSGDTSVEVTLVASEAIEALGSLDVDGIVYDSNAFSISNDDVESAPWMSVNPNVAAGVIGVDTEDGAAIAVGDNLLKLTFTKTDSFVATTEYTFGLHVKEATNLDGDELSWGNNIDYSVKFQEEEPETPEEYVTFIDTAGTEYQLKTSLIESCAKTSNENYMLSDVLTAAGVDSANLADCRYVVKASDGFIANLDADLLNEDIALFYKNGWRTTLEKNIKNYSGEWYKVKNIVSITAQNHHYTEGVCDNQIDYSRQTGDPCGAEDPEYVPEEYVTFIDTAGTEYQLKTSLIESCAKTSNENYMLSDVLTAAGVDSANLADCRYVVKASDGFIANLDADLLNEDIALFYKNGWRTTLEKNIKNYSGEWYKVKNIVSITAQNHHYTEGVCDNQIDYSRQTGDPCGAEDPEYVQTGWQTIDGKTYYLDENGEKVTGWQTIDGNKYYFKKTNGVMVIGWNHLSNTYYHDENGVMLTGWQEIDGKKYYFKKSNGAMVTGWNHLSSTYYHDENGVMLTGWQTIDGNKYYFKKSNGKMVTGWNYLSSTYYHNPDGTIVTGTVTIDGQEYTFDDNGRLVN